jgi:hypothetical protein
MSPPSHLSEAEVVKVASKEIDSGRAAERKQRSDDPQTDQEIACPVRSIPYYEQDEMENRWKFLSLHLVAISLGIGVLGSGGRFVSRMTRQYLVPPAVSICISTAII